MHKSKLARIHLTQAIKIRSYLQLQLTEENLENKVEGQNEPNEEKPEPAFVEKLPIQTKALNPEAPAWKNGDTRFPIMGNEATRSTPTVYNSYFFSNKRLSWH